MAGRRDFDAVVIGAGAGGLGAAARLTERGHRVLVVEADVRVGGRASSRAVEGYVLNTGALAIERDGPIAQLYRDLGLHLDLRVPERHQVVAIGRRAVSMSGGLGGLARGVVPKALRALTVALPRLAPQPGQSTRSWLSRFTRSETVHGLVDNVCGSFFAAAGDDLPAEVFLHYLTEGSAFKNLGFASGGTVAVWEPLAAYVREHGGEVWLDSPARRIVLGADGTAEAVEVEHAGETLLVGTDAVVSNAGPRATVQLIGEQALPDDYPGHVVASNVGGAILTLHFCSRTPLVSWPAIALAARSRRVTYMLNASAPELRRTPGPGHYLYSASSTPRPATGTFDLDEEKELLLADVREYFPGFDQHARVLALDVAAGEEPAQRAITGYDLPVTTPIPNVWNVGDGVKPWGDAGTAACVRSADDVVDRIEARSPAADRRGAVRYD